MNQGDSSVATILPDTSTGHTLSIVEAPTPREEVDWKLDQAREQLLVLRRQQDELERQKGDLEELRRKQGEYSRGKLEMTDSLTRGLVTLEREQIEAQRRVELCEKTSTAFREYLEQLQALNDKNWTSATVRGELNKALALIENSRLEYNRACTKLDGLNPAADLKEELIEPAKGKTVDWPEMIRYACIGAAASTPLIVAGTIWLIVMLIAHR